MMLPLFSPPKPQVTFGTYKLAGLLKRPFAIGPSEVARHKHVIGLSGYGKSDFLANLCRQYLRLGIQFSLIDPAGDLAKRVIQLLAEDGYFEQEGAFQKLWYIDFNRRDRAVPFNILQQPSFSPRDIAEHVKTACVRVWSSLAGGKAPLMEDIIKHATVCLVRHGLPITSLPAFLTQPQYRNSLLSQLPDDPDVAEFFHDEYDSWKSGDAAQMRQSTLTRARLLTFHDALRSPLSQRENKLDFTRIIDAGISVIYDMNALDLEQQQLLGCLLTVGYEKAAMARARTKEENRRQHQLIIDEFALYCALSEDGFQSFLSQTRKYNVFLTVSHQNFSQTSSQLKDSLENADSVVFKLNRADSLWMAPRLKRFKGMDVKHEVADDHAKERTHPAFKSKDEQFEEMAQELADLEIGDAYTRFGTRVTRIRTTYLPKPTVSDAYIASILERYADRLLQPVAASQAPQNDAAITPIPIYSAQPVPVFQPRQRRTRTAA